MMKAYFCGQIIKEKRGDLGVAVKADVNNPGAFIYPVFSDEFNHITGPGSVNTPLQRVYIGVNQEAATVLARLAQDLVYEYGGIGIEELDRFVVYSHFLTKEKISQPDQITC
jgi:hypothetical protein